MATTQFTLTQAAGTSAKKFTVSMWWKPGTVDTNQGLWGCGTGTSDAVSIHYQSGGNLSLETYDGSLNPKLRTTRAFRDPAAWYHLVFSIDTTDSSASERLKIWINGVEETDFITDTTITQDSDIPGWSAASDVMKIGNRILDGDAFFDGEMAHVHVIDGTIYAASAFGETDSTSGIWVAKTGPSVTYGTNGGFYKFVSGALTTDSSGESNTLTQVGSPTTTQDNPDNNFATLNPLDTSFGTTPTISNGNTTTTTPDSWAGSTIPIQSGKWYWEVKVPSAGVECVTGVLLANHLNYSGTDWLGVSIAGVYGFAGLSGNKITSGTAASYDSAISTNDVMRFAMDAAAGSLYVGVNGTWLQSSNPATSTSPMISGMGTSETWIPFATTSSTGGYCINNFNFGNGYFGTTSHGETNADDAGIGLFKYDVPAGYYALCTNNLGDQS